jgi:hypothetical protein
MRFYPTRFFSGLLGRSAAAQTGQARAEGKKAARAKARGGAAGATRAELYDTAKRRNVPGRSKMSKQQLGRAVKRRSA